METVVLFLCVGYRGGILRVAKDDEKPNLNEQLQVTC